MDYKALVEALDFVAENHSSCWATARMVHEELGDRAAAGMMFFGGVFVGKADSILEAGVTAESTRSHKAYSLLEGQLLEAA